jgi:predicted oxidoreductase
MGASVEQVALAWVLRHPARALPVMGTGKIERLRAAVAAEAIVLDRQQWFAVWEASAGQEVP